jgi:hypothetical protein
MAAKYFLAAFGMIFMVMATLRLARDGQTVPASRTWLTIGAIFIGISAYLWMVGKCR